MKRIGPTEFVGASPEDLKRKLLPTGQRRRRLRRSKGKGPGGFWVIKSTEGEVSLPDYKPMPLSEFVRAMRAAQAGDEDARNCLWERNSRLVFHVLGRYGGRTQNLADMCQAGQFGVLRAIERFELDRLNEFSTYASFWIRSKADRVRVSLRYPVKVPSYIFDELRKYIRAHRNALSRDEQFDIDEALLQKHKRRFVAVKRAMAIIEAEPLARADELPWPRPSAVEKQVHEDTLQEVRDAVEQLDERSQQVIRLRYGLDGGDPMVLKDIGGVLGVTRERVRQIQVQAEAELRNLLGPAGRDFSLLNRPLTPNRVPEFKTIEFVERQRVTDARKRLKQAVRYPSLPFEPPKKPLLRNRARAVSSQLSLFPQKARRTIRP